jgi:integrase
MKIALTSNAMISGLKLPAGATEEKFFDHGHEDAVPGFGLRVRASGARTWFLQYNFATRDYRVKIGTHPPLSLERARSKARKLREAIDDGGNPAVERKEKTKRAGETFGWAATQFLDRQRKRLKPRSLVEIERHLEQAKPLHAKLLTGVDRRAVAGLLAQIEENHGPAAANRCRATLSALFTWSIRQGLVDNNPVGATGKADEGAARERVLTDVELGEVWRTLPDGDDYADIARVLILTGQRREEIGGLRWSEVDLAAATITLPPARTKNKRQHVIPLSAPALAILQARDRRPGRDLVFGGGQGGYSGWSAAKEALDERMKAVRGKAKPMAPWVLHDVRRTAATRMADLGVLPHVIEAVVNHISGHKAGVAGIYNRSSYEPEKRRALDMLAEHIMAAVEGAERKVVPMRPTAPGRTGST